MAKVKIKEGSFTVQVFNDDRPPTMIFEKRFDNLNYIGTEVEVEEEGGQPGKMKMRPNNYEGTIERRPKPE